MNPRRPSRATGMLLNVSDGGALISCEMPLTVGDHLSVRLDSPVRTDWKSAQVVRDANTGQHGLRFLGSPPLDIILAATLGIDLMMSLFQLPEEERFSRADD